MKNTLLRLIIVSAVALAASCERPPGHQRLYTNTNEIPAHAIEAAEAFQPFGNPELRKVFEQTAAVVKEASRNAKQGIQISPTFWYQNADSAKGEVYTKLVLDFGPFDGYKEWNPFLDSIESKFHADWKRAAAEIKARYELEAYMLYAFNPDERMGSFTLNLRKKQK